MSHAEAVRENYRRQGEARAVEVVLDIAQKIKCENSIGEYVYVSDLKEYLVEAGLLKGETK